jgi:mannose-6-phosphate isomerase-like protein (cupin superfamily)
VPRGAYITTTYRDLEIDPVTPGVAVASGLFETVFSHWIDGSSEGRSVDKVNIEERFSRFAEHWSPRIVAELNGQQVKLVKLMGEFVWHHHEHEDELFLVVKGALRMKLRDREVLVNEGEFIVVPRGVEHLPIADEEAHVLLMEPAGTLNTGNVRNERTVDNLERG